MKSIRIKNTAFTKVGNTPFITQCAVIQHSLEMNADVFPSPPVSVADFRDALNDLRQKNSLADDGSRTAKNARDIQKSVLLTIVRQTGSYVIGIASVKPTFEEQKAIVQRAGFPLAKDPNRLVGPINAPRSLNATTPSVQGTGQVDLKWKRGGRGAYSFSIQSRQGNSEEGAENWTTIGTSMNTKFKATGLQSGVWVFRVIAHGTAGPSLPSNVVFIAVW